MSQVDYSAMSDGELKRYFLKNRGEKAALQAYLYRRKKRSNSIIIKVGDSDFDTNTISPKVCYNNNESLRSVA